MKKPLDLILNVFRFHKFKIVVLALMTLAFCIVLFPYEDLGDWVTVKVSELTQKQFYLQFEKMGFTLFPQPGLEFEKVYFESTLSPSMQVGALTIAPSIHGLLTLKPGVTIYAKNFLNGDLSLSTRGGEKTAKGDRKQILQFDLQNVRLQEILKLVEAPISFNGAVKGDTELTIDPGFSDQPVGKIELRIEKFHLPPSSVATPFGPMNLPEIKVSFVTVKCRLVSGELYIDSLQIGDSKDELNGTVKGQMQLSLLKRGIQITPQLGRFDFNIDVSTVQRLEKNAAPYLQ